MSAGATGRGSGGRARLGAPRAPPRRGREPRWERSGRRLPFPGPGLRPPALPLHSCCLSFSFERRLPVAFAQLLASPSAAGAGGGSEAVPFNPVGKRRPCLSDCRYDRVAGSDKGGAPDSRPALQAVCLPCPHPRTPVLASPLPPLCGAYVRGPV